MPEILSGLTINDYVHPEDVAAINALKKVPKLDELFTKLGDNSNRHFMHSTALGKYVRINKETCPEIYNVVERVCKILDYDKIPEVFTRRSCSLNVEVGGVDQPMLVIPDFIINNYDEKLMLFAVGRAVSKLKTDYLKYYSIARIAIDIVEFSQHIPDSINVLFAKWMQKAELTADRGGLLACQDCKTAIRCLMNIAGMPVDFTKDISVSDYIEACKCDSKLVKASRNLLTLTNCTGWSNDRIIELFNWYSGQEYGDILDKYSF